jgi:DNA polymerase-4
VGDVATIPRRTLERAVGNATGGHLHLLANGIDDRPVIPDGPAKSVGSEETFSSDLDDNEIILREVLRLADRTASRLREKGMCGRTVTLKVRWSNFKTITRSRTMEAEFDNAAEIYEAVKGLYLKLDPQRPRIRLLGVAVSSLAPGPPRRQLLLDDSGRSSWNEAALAVDDIRRRFGEEAVTPATLLDSISPGRTAE